MKCFLSTQHDDKEHNRGKEGRMKIAFVLAASSCLASSQLAPDTRVDQNIFGESLCSAASQATPVRFVDQQQGLVLGPDDGEKLVRRWGYPFLMKVDENNGGAQQFVVGSEKLPPGKSVHVHMHDYAEEILIITSGNGTATLGDKRAPVGPGTLVFIPRHTWAGLDNTGAESLGFLWLFPSPGIEKYFRATSVPFGQAPPELSKAEMDSIRATYSQYVTYRDDELKDYAPH
jgi:quercetin dioxygenase-like cupin family protein